MRAQRHVWPAALLGCALGLASLAFAGDGRIELNQTSVATGNSQIGDAPGFPLTLGVPGSYVLTSDLVMTNPATAPVVSVTAQDVTLDLAGFTITCGPSPCPPGPGSGFHGVAVGASADETVIRNGLIRGMSDSGIGASAAVVVEDVRLVENGDSGAVASVESRFSRCLAERNGNRGFDLTGSAIVESSVARDNGQSGGAGAIGLATGRHSIVTSSLSVDNPDEGFQVGEGSVTVGNVSASNGGIGFRDDSSGPSTLSSTVIGNTASSNGGVGLHLENGGFGRNTFQNNNNGNANPQTSGGNYLMSNVCATNTTCP